MVITYLMHFLELGWRGLAQDSLGEIFTDSGLDDPDTETTENLGAKNLLFDFRDSDGNSIHSPGEQSEPFTDSDGDNIFDQGTIASRDTDGDGTPNFAADYDPPFYNTVPDNYSIPGCNYDRSRTDRIQGSTTDPNNPDTDGDGIPDGIEDSYNPMWSNGQQFETRVHNGWVDGDELPYPLRKQSSPRSTWPNGKMDDGENWLGNRSKQSRY